MAGRRANYQWSTGQAASWTNLNASSDALASLITAEDPTTLRRIIVDFYVTLQDPADAIQCFGRVGIIVADATVITAGVTSMPKPFAGGDQEWLWNRGYAHFNEGVAAPVQVLHLHDDVRAMRRMKQTDSLAFVIENEAGGALRFMISVRALFST